MLFQSTSEMQLLSLMCHQKIPTPSPKGTHYIMIIAISIFPFLSSLSLDIKTIFLKIIIMYVPKIGAGGFVACITYTACSWGA